MASSDELGCLSLRRCEESTTFTRRRSEARPLQTQLIVTSLTAISIIHLRNVHSVYIGAGATLAAVVGMCKTDVRCTAYQADYRGLYPIYAVYSQDTEAVHSATAA